MAEDFSREEIEEEIDLVKTTLEELKFGESEKPRVFIKDISCPKGITLNSQLVDLLSIIDEDIPESEKDKKILVYLRNLNKRTEKYKDLKMKGNRIKMFRYMLNEALSKIPGLTDYERKVVEKLYIDSIPSLGLCDASEMRKKLSERGLSKDIHEKIFKIIKEQDSTAKEGILSLTPKKVRALYNHMFENGNTYDRVTFDNVGKYSGYVASDGETYAPEQMEKMVRFCEKHGMKAKVNTLLFYADFPKDLENALDIKVSKGEITEKEKKAKIKESLFSYVKALGEKFGDRIDCVDIFNELICDPDMKEPGFDEDSYGNIPKEYHLRQKGWFKYLDKDDLCEFALCARKAMPNVTFTFNDVNWVVPEKRKEIIKLIKGIQEKEKEYRKSGKLGKDEKGLIDNIGLEAHLSTDVDVDELRHTLDDLESEVGLPIEVTELDVCRNPRSPKSTKEIILQNGILRRIMQFAQDGRISYATVWSQSDEMSFLNRIIGKNVHASAILDDNCEEKKIPFDKDSIEAEQDVFRDKAEEIPVQKYNYHTHTPLCGHADGEMEEYIEMAINAGMTSLGFSDHTPNAFGKNNPKQAMTMEQFEKDYIPRLKELKEKYKDRIDIKIGIETEYFGDEAERVPQIQSMRKRIDSKLEYRILGQHSSLKRKDDGRYVVPYAMADKKSSHYPLDYAYAVAEGIRSGKFAYVAHPDIFLQNRFDIPENKRDEYERNAQKATEIICEAAAECGIPLEVNLGSISAIKAGIKKPLPNGEYEYPVPYFWRVAESKGCKALIGIDAHTPEALIDRRNEIIVRKMLKRNGIDLDFIESFNPVKSEKKTSLDESDDKKIQEPEEQGDEGGDR